MVRFSVRWDCCTPECDGDGTLLPVYIVLAWSVTPRCVANSSSLDPCSGRRRGTSRSLPLRWRIGGKWSHSHGKGFTCTCMYTGDVMCVYMYVGRGETLCTVE